MSVFNVGEQVSIIFFDSQIFYEVLDIFPGLSYRLTFIMLNVPTCQDGVENHDKVYNVVVFFSVRAIRILLCKSILLIGLCGVSRISCNGWFYFIFDMICMSLDMICISKRKINFHQSISIKANGIMHFLL